MADRIPCINRSCRRTGNAAKMPDTSAIICGRCWAKLPGKLRHRYTSVRQRERSLRRMAEKRAAAGTLPPYRLFVLGRLIDKQLSDCDARISSHFNAPPPPESLDNFLKEMGL